MPTPPPENVSVLHLYHFLFSASNLYFLPVSISKNVLPFLIRILPIFSSGFSSVERPLISTNFSLY